jgi:hypothetical protein
MGPTTAPTRRTTCDPTKPGCDLLPRPLLLRDHQPRQRGTVESSGRCTASRAYPHVSVAKDRAGPSPGRSSPEEHLCGFQKSGTSPTGSSTSTNPPHKTAGQMPWPGFGTPQGTASQIGVRTPRGNAPASVRAGRSVGKRPAVARQPQPSRPYHSALGATHAIPAATIAGSRVGTAPEHENPRNNNPNH